jgi:predicted esterase
MEMMLTLVLSGLLLGSYSIFQPQQTTIASQRPAQVQRRWTLAVGPWTFPFRTGTPRFTPQTEQIPTGKIVDKVACAKNAAQSYALFVPSNYTPARAWPILYAFDPGARGNVPVNRFQEAAEKYGWIIAASNNSRNGPMQSSREAWEAMWDDTHRRFSLDGRRAYAAGFSGGARVAISLAYLCGDCISGVIASGAGFPQGLVPKSDLGFILFATAGFEDFNFPEVRNLDEALAKAGLTHRVDFFEGRHEWLPVAQATAALEWMELQALKAGKRRRDDRLPDAQVIAEVWEHGLQKARAFEESKRILDAYRVYAGVAASLKGLRNVSELQEKIHTLADSRELKDAQRDEQRQIKKQQDLNSQLNAVLSQRASATQTFEADSRLKGMLTDLGASAKAATDTSDRRVARRVLEGLFVQMFEQGLDLLQRQRRYAEAARLFETGTEVNPERPGMFYYLASAYALNGDKKKSLKALQTAIQKGFSDRDSITSNSAFDSLRNEPLYLQLIQNLKPTP